MRASLNPLKPSTAYGKGGYGPPVTSVCPRPHPVRLPFLAGSQTLYTQLMKDAALCRNRGGEQLAGIWGQLMVYGTVPGVNPCGSVNMASYFQQ